MNVPDDGTSGGLVGERNDGNIASTFYTNHQFAESQKKGTAITLNQLEDESSFTDAGWNFTDVWLMDTDSGPPVLQWE